LLWPVGLMFVRTVSATGDSKRLLWPVDFGVRARWAAPPVEIGGISNRSGGGMWRFRFAQSLLSCSVSAQSAQSLLSSCSAQFLLSLLRSCSGLRYK